MFPLTRPQRQVLATLALVFLTVVPTLYVVGTAWRINRKGHLREVESELGSELGLHVTLEGVAYPRPGEVVYRGIVLRQEEPRRQGLTELARAHTLRIDRSAGDKPELTLKAEGLELRGESPRQVLAQVVAWLSRKGFRAYSRVSLTAPTCLLDLGDEHLHFPLRDLAGSLQADAGAPSVLVSYRVAPAGGSRTRCELSLVRDRKSDPVRTTLVFRTMEGPPLPARVLDLFVDAERWLGTSAGVEGVLTLRQAGAKDWEADFTGDLLGVDLATLVDQRFPGQHLSGKARVAIKSARWADRPGQGAGWVEARGELTTGQGSIGIPLLRSLASEMSFRLNPKLGLDQPENDERRPIIDFRTLGLAFAITPEGEIQCDGALGSDYAPDVVLATAGHPIAFAPRGAANVRGLIKTLFPVEQHASGVMVPLTPALRVLLCLPVPPDLADKGARRLDGN